jgi:hypothetical protein
MADKKNQACSGLSLMTLLLRNYELADDDADSNAFGLFL